MPYKAVVKRECCFDQTRIVYDASARSNESSPSLNDCLEVGPPLQNQLWSVLVRGRSHAIALTADIRMAFLQVRTHPDDKDALRFHWPENKGPLRVCILRFTRALFGLGRPPFLLGGVVQDHDKHSTKCRFLGGRGSSRRNQPQSRQRATRCEERKNNPTRIEMEQREGYHRSKVLAEREHTV